MRRKDVRTFSAAGAVLLLVLLLSTPPVVLAQDDKTPTEGTLSGGNTIYRVFVQDIAGAGVGLYTATTGSAHPAGAGLNVLFGGGFPGTTFNTIRSYTTSTDYVQTFFIPSSSNTVILLDSFGTVTPIGTTGFRTTYTLPGPPTTPDALTIISDVNVNGTTFSDSSIEVTTTVINNGPDPVDIGTRYHWDFLISGDDGPTFQEINPDGAVRILESGFVTPGFESYRIVDNDINPTPPTFFIFGTVTGPATVVPTPTAPDLLQYVCWPLAFFTAFDYTVLPTRDVATTASTDCRGFAGGDTAVHYFFGRDGANATTIPPNGENTVSASMFLTPPVVFVLTVDIDIKPGSDPNSINLSSAGNIPVAILSTPTFDAVSEVDSDSLRLAGAAVNLIGRSGKFQCSSEDVNADGLLDLLCHFETASFFIEEGETIVVLEGQTLDGVPIRGEDSVRIVPD